MAEKMLFGSGGGRRCWRGAVISERREGMTLAVIAKRKVSWQTLHAVEDDHLYRPWLPFPLILVDSRPKYETRTCAADDDESARRVSRWTPVKEMRDYD